MRKVIYGGACSLDGFFTARDGAIDWLHFSKDVEAIMRQSWAETDTVLLGRKTWEWAAAQAAAAGRSVGTGEELRLLAHAHDDPGQEGRARHERRRRVRARSSSSSPARTSS